ncbi:menaquinone biosynthetic enzyme MqnA/MqnD family protein [Gorillibacterium sp. sgz5001074]|uniref:menaquinone biosynthetic enzyme MqnA/MqnD family protein n=1 Tax=Gorillibacterium sp. sgz5001074 TaxID=3446695 RepID=UPI003F66C181
MSERPIRIGRIDYTNVWPVFHHFAESRFAGRLELVLQVPAQLNRGMAEGSIDMGPISSFAYGEHADEYVLMPDLSVSAWGKVNSILLFHRKPLEEVAQGRIALVNTSATSVNLLKILMERFYGGKPEYFSYPPKLDEMMEQADAALLIGDDAIRSSWENHGYRVTDLGEEWNRLTGCWMSFAVWAIRQETVEREPGLVAEIYRSFLESKAKGLKDPTGMISRAVETVGGTEEYWHRYFGQLNHDFGRPQWEGLSLYFRYAYELGLLKNLPPIRIWNENQILQVTE